LPESETEGEQEREGERGDQETIDLEARRLLITPGLHYYKKSVV
jgi:hypothetical protein